MVVLNPCVSDLFGHSKGIKMATVTTNASTHLDSKNPSPSNANLGASSEKQSKSITHNRADGWGASSENSASRLLILDPDCISVGEMFNRSEEAYSADSFDQLCLSILKNGGNAEPITVYPAAGAQGKFVLVSGERRLRACRENGCRVFALVTEQPNSGQFEIDGLIKNLNREALSAYELGKQVQFIIDQKLGCSLGNLAVRTGMDKSMLSRAYEIARLPLEIISAFGSTRDLRYSDGKPLREALEMNPDAVILAAKKIAEEASSLKPSEVISRLQAAASGVEFERGELDPTLNDAGGVAACNSSNDVAIEIDGQQVATIDINRKGLVKIAFKVPMNDKQQRSLRTQIEGFIRKRVLQMGMNSTGRKIDKTSAVNELTEASTTENSKVSK